MKVPEADRARERPVAAGVRESGAGRQEGEEAALLAAVRRGDAEAFEAVAREHAPMLYRIALHLTGRPEDAEDLAQETLVRALPALRRFEGRARLATYLVRALGNLWKNRLRSRARSRLVDWARGRGKDAQGDAEAPLDFPDRAPSPLERLEAEDRAMRVRSAVGRLDPDRRMTLLLREVEELSYEEIATVTGVRVGTVRSRLARAREELRGLLGDRA